MAASGGRWININEMEDTLTLDELYSFHNAMFRAEHRRNKFAAALKGVDLDKADSDAKFDEIRAKADAILAGVPEDEYDNNDSYIQGFPGLGAEEDEDEVN